MPRRLNLIIFLVVSCSIAGCSGGGGGGENGALKGGPADCNNASITVGDTITIPSAGIDPESLDSSSDNPVTVLMGGHPVDPGDMTIDESGTLEIAVKSLVSGKVNIEIASGERFKVLCRNIQVVSAPKALEGGCSDETTCPDGQVCQDGSCVAEAPGPTEPTEPTPPSGGGTEPAGGEGETIIPTEPGGTTTDDDGDGVANNIDACPGTGPGIIIDATGCPASSTPPGGGGGTTPTPTAATINSFTVTKSTATGAALSTWKVKWSLANATAAYIWADILNREGADAGLPVDDRCGKTGSRYLVTTPAGDEISGNATAQSHINNLPFLEGIPCNNTNGSTADDCKTQTPPSGAGAKANPDCRIDLKTSTGQVIASKEIYTRSLIHNGTACIVAKGTDDVWKEKCVEVEAPEVAITIGTSGVSVASNAPKVAIVFDYVNAVSQPKVTWRSPKAPSKNNCVKTGGGVSSFDPKKGNGHYEGTCDLAKNEKGLLTEVEITANGIGLDNRDEEKYRLEMKDPVLTFDFEGGKKSITKCDQDSETPKVGEEDCSGNVNFKWSVKRAYSVKDMKTNSSTPGESHLFKLIKLSSGQQIDCCSDGGSGFIKAKRDHDHTSWTAVGRDLDDKEFGNITKQWPYTPEFNVSGPRQIDCWAGDCDDCCGGAWCDDECGRCAETERARMKVDIQWSGKHIKQITSNCSALNIKPGQPSNGNYRLQQGSFEGTFSQGGSFNAETCTFTATKSGGGTIAKTGSWPKCSCPRQENCS